MVNESYETRDVAQTIPAPSATQREVTRWEIDPAHSEVGFSVKHMMISTVRGQFRDFQGYIDFDEDNPTAASINVTIDASSIDTGSPDRDNHLRSAEFFDAERYPAITFISKRIEQRRGDRFRVIGDLTMHGVTREVELDATYEGTNKDPWGNMRAAFTASTEVNRQDFGLTWNAALETGGVLVGEKVKINLDVQTVKQG